MLEVCHFVNGWTVDWAFIAINSHVDLGLFLNTLFCFLSVLHQTRFLILAGF